MKFRHFVIVMAITVLFILLIIPDVDAQSVVPPEADAQVVEFTNSQRGEQAAFKVANGHYFQTLKIAREFGDGVPVYPPCPNDRAACPKVTLPHSTRQVFLTVNVYESPAGWGYEIVSEYVDNKGVVYRRTENQGPEVWRARGWQIVPPEERQ